MKTPTPISKQSRLHYKSQSGIPVYRNIYVHSMNNTKHIKMYAFSALLMKKYVVESSWNVMAHGDAREKWRGNKRTEWVTSKRHMTAEYGLARAVPTLQADAHSSPASSRLNWRPRWFKRTRPFCWNMKSGFCACATTFQMQSTTQGPFVHTMALKSPLQNLGQW